MKELHKRSRNPKYKVTHFWKFAPYFRKPNSPTICTPPQFLAIHNTHLDSCVNTVGDTILMYVKPWFSSKAGKDFLKRENGGGLYYIIFGEEGIEYLNILEGGVIRFDFTPRILTLFVNWGWLPMVWD